MQDKYFQRVGERGWLFQRVLRSCKEHRRIGIWGWSGVDETGPSGKLKMHRSTPQSSEMYLDIASGVNRQLKPGKCMRTVARFHAME